MSEPPKIDGREVLYQGWCRLERLTITATGMDGRRGQIVREVHDHGSGVAVLPYDAARRTALLVRQLRAPVLAVDGQGKIVEAGAGLIDPGDPNPETALLREAREELGYALRDLVPVGRVYSSPGSLTELIHLFLASYSPADRIGAGGGIAGEGEDIEVLERPLAQLAVDADGGAVRDMKTLALIQTLRLKEPQLFVD